MKLISKYSSILEKKPILSRSLTTGVLACAGDAIAQIFIEKRKLNPTLSTEPQSFDFARNLRAFTIGFSVLSLNMYAWYHRVIPALISRLRGVSFVQSHPNLFVTLLGTPNA